MAKARAVAPSLVSAPPLSFKALVPKEALLPALKAPSVSVVSPE